MSYNFKQFPEGSLLSQLEMDVYATKDEVTILYDRPLTKELLGLEYNPNNKELWFSFPPGKLPLGMPLTDEIDRIIKQVQTVTLIHINTQTQEAISGMEVPIKIL